VKILTATVTALGLLVGTTSLAAAGSADNAQGDGKGGAVSDSVSGSPGAAGDAARGLTGGWGGAAGVNNDNARSVGAKGDAPSGSGNSRGRDK